MPVKIQTMSIKRGQFFGSVEVESNLNYLAQQRRIQRIKDVREQERRISMNRSEKYRDCINERKAIKTNAIKQCKIEKIENTKQELVYQWQSALANTGHAHRSAVEETKRRRIEKTAEDRHAQQLNEVSRQRELAALRLRQQQILDMQQHAVEIRELKKVRDELKQSEREDAHEAGVSFATRQKMLENERAWREYHTNGHSVKDETKKITQSAVSVQQRFPVNVRARVLRHGTGPRDMKMIINSASDEEAAQMKRMWSSVMVELLNKKVILARAKQATVKVKGERGAQFLEDELKLLEAVDKANARMSRIVSADKIVDTDIENLKLKNRFEHIFMSRQIDLRPTAPIPPKKPAAAAAAAVVSPKSAGGGVAHDSYSAVPQPSRTVPKPVAPSPKWTVLRSASQQQQTARRTAENDVFQMFPATVEDDSDSCVSSALSFNDDDSLNYPAVPRHPTAVPVPPVMQKQPSQQQQQQFPSVPSSTTTPPLSGKQAVAALPLNLQKSPPPTILVDFTPRDYSNGDSGDKKDLSGVINGSWLAEQVDVLSKRGKKKTSKQQPHVSASSAPASAPASTVTAAPVPTGATDSSGAAAVAARLLSPALSREASGNSPLLPAPIMIPHLQSFASVESQNISEASDDTPVARHDKEVHSPHPVRPLDSYILAATPAAGTHRKGYSFGSSGSGSGSSSGSDVAGWRQTNVNLSTSEGSSVDSSHLVSPDRSHLVEQSLNSSVALSDIMARAPRSTGGGSHHSNSSSGASDSADKGHVWAPTTPRARVGAASNPFSLSSNEDSAIVSPTDSPFRPTPSDHDATHPSQRKAAPTMAVDASLDSTMTADSISGLYIGQTSSRFTQGVASTSAATAATAATASGSAIVFDDSSEEVNMDDEDQSSLYADYQQLNEMLSQSALTEASFNPPARVTTAATAAVTTRNSTSHSASRQSAHPAETHLARPSTARAAASAAAATTNALGTWSVVRSVDDSMDSQAYSVRSSDSSFAFNEQLSRQSLSAAAVGGGVDDSFGGLSLASSQSSVVFPPSRVDFRYSSGAAGASSSSSSSAAAVARTVTNAVPTHRVSSSGAEDDSFLSGGDLSMASESTESSSVVIPGGVVVAPGVTAKYSGHTVTATTSGTSAAVAVKSVTYTHSPSSSSVSSTESGVRSPSEQQRARLTTAQTSTPLTNYSLNSSVGAPAASSSTSGIYGTSILTVNSLSRSPHHQENEKHSRSGSSSGSSSVVIPGIAVDDSVMYGDSDADEEGDGANGGDISDGYLSEQSLDSLA